MNLIYWTCFYLIYDDESANRNFQTDVWFWDVRKLQFPVIARRFIQGALTLSNKIAEQWHIDLAIRDNIVDDGLKMNNIAIMQVDGLLMLNFEGMLAFVLQKGRQDLHKLQALVQRVHIDPQLH